MLVIGHSSSVYSLQWAPEELPLLRWRCATLENLADCYWLCIPQLLLTAVHCTWQPCMALTQSCDKLQPDLSLRTLGVSCVHAIPLEKWAASLRCAEQRSVMVNHTLFCHSPWQMPASVSGVNSACAGVNSACAVRKAVLHALCLTRQCRCAQLGAAMVSLKRLTMFFTLKDRSDEVRIHASKVPYLGTACLHRACYLLRFHRVYCQRRASRHQKLACMYIEVSGSIAELRAGKLPPVEVE